MQNNYIQKSEQYNQENPSTLQWDIYVDRQMKHLVLEYEFDFDKVSKLLIGPNGKSGQYSKNMVQERWNYLHKKRRQDKHKSKEDLRLDRVAKSVMRFEDPKFAITVEELIDKLPQNRKKVNFLNVTEDEIKNSQYLDEQGHKQQINTFNVLKDSVRGIKDPVLREKDYREKEREFLNNLSKIADNPDPDMFEKPMIFKAQFQSHKDFQVQKEELTEQYAKQLLAQRIKPGATQGFSMPQPSQGFEMDNYTSNFAGLDTDPYASSSQYVSSVQQSSTSNIQTEKSESEYEQEDSQQNVTQIPQIKRNNFMEQNSESEQEQNQKKQQKEQDLKQLLDIQDSNQNNQQKQQQQVQKEKQIKQNQKIDQINSQLTEDLNQNNIFFDLIKTLKKKPQQEIKKQQQKSRENLNKDEDDVEEDEDEEDQSNEDDDLQDDEEDGDEEEDDDAFFEIQRKAIKANKSIQEYKRDEKLKLKEQKKQDKLKKLKQKQLEEGDEDEDEGSDSQKSDQEVGITQFIKKKKEKLTKAQKIKEQQELWEKQKEEERFKASLEHKKFIEIQKRNHELKELERKKNQEEIDRINKIFDDKRNQIEKEKQEKQQRILDEQIEKQAEKQRQERQKQKELQEKHFRESLIWLEAKEIEDQANQVETYNIALQLAIENLKLQENSQNFFDKEITYTQPISGLPQQIIPKFQDFKEYDISRDGITSRYQTLVFPYLENGQFASQFISFFIRNSFLRTNPTKEEMGDLSNYVPSTERKTLEEILEDVPQGYPRLSSHGFPFCLISYFIGSYSKNIETENGAPLSNYLTKQSIVLDQLENHTFKKCIFLFFDTSLGRGRETLGKKLDITLGEIIDQRTIYKCQKQYKHLNIQSNTKLSEFMIEYQKQMELTNQLFGCETFHSICPYKPSLDLNLFKEQPHFEQQVIIVRSYSEIVNVQNNKIFGGDSRKSQTQYNQTVTGLDSEAQSNIEGFSITQASQKKKQQMFSIVSRLIEELDKKGIHINGMKTYYLTSENLEEYQETVDSHFRLPNHSECAPLLVLAVSGNSLQEKLKLLIGSVDPHSAKKCQPNSLNAMFYNNYDDSIYTGENQQMAKKMLSYFFSGRVKKVENFKELSDIRKMNDDNSNKKLYIIKPKATNPVFLINSPQLEQKTMIISSHFPQSKYSQILKVIQKRGFKILNLKMISDKDIQNSIKEKPENKLILEQNKLLDFNFSQEENVKNKVHSVNLVLKLQGFNFHSLRGKLLKKVMNYNSFIHPPKSQIIYFQKSLSHKFLHDPDYNQIQEDENKFKENQTNIDRIFLHQFLGLTKNPQFTKNKQFKYFTVLIPFFHENTQIDIQIFDKLGFELVGIRQKKLPETGRDDLTENFRKQIHENFRVNSKFTKRKPQYNHFCNLLAKRIVKEEFFIAFYRLQEEDFQEDKQSKLYETLLQEHIMVNSNKTFSEQNILTQGVLKKEVDDVPIEFFETLFFEVQEEDFIVMALNLKMKLYDDTTLQNSFIFDLPPIEQSEDEFQTCLILSQDAIQVLTKQFVIKKMENEDFKIELMQKGHIGELMAENICQNWDKMFQLIDSTQDKSGLLQTIKQSISQAHTQLIEEPVYIFVLRKQNAVFTGKKLLQEFIIQYQKFSENTDKSTGDQDQNVHLQHPIIFSINKILYSSFNYINSVGDIDLINNRVIPKLLKVQQDIKEISQEQITNKDQQTLVLFKSDNVTDVLKKLQENRYQILNIAIFKSFNTLQSKKISQMFHPKHDPTILEKCLDIQNKKDGSFCILQLSNKTQPNTMNLFGLFKITETGNYVNMIAGSIFPKKPNFLIYSQDPKNIESINQFAFQN